MSRDTTPNEYDILLREGLYDFDDEKDNKASLFLNQEPDTLAQQRQIPSEGLGDQEDAREFLYLYFSDIDLNYQEDLVDVKKKGHIRSEPLMPLPDPPWKRRRTVEAGGPSSVPCLICSAAIPPSLIWSRLNCNHTFCVECLKDYVIGKFQENNVGHLKCPESKCQQVIKPDSLQDIIPVKVVERWKISLLEGDALANPVVISCPFVDCWGKFLDDKRGFLIRACAHCWKIFCIECRVAWHLGRSCSEFQIENQLETSPTLFLSVRWIVCFNSEGNPILRGVIDDM